MFRFQRTLAAAVLIAAGLMPLAAPAAAEIKIIDANALTLAMKEIAASFTRETGHEVTFTGMSPGLVDQRIKAGEVYDIIINATAMMAAYEKEGRLRAGTRRPFARVGIGVALREGSKIDLSTVETFKKALLDAKSIVYSDTATGGLSGVNARKVIANLGLTETLQPKIKVSNTGQELVGKGEVEIGLYNLSEIPRAANVVRAGPVPAPVQVYIEYDAAIPTTNATPEPAMALLKYFARPAAHPIWDKAGLEVVGNKD
jgi:molybdate transport system substrate-binding protein